ncbi:Hypothetical predicted protein [Lecanosticta acicola]|uniref:Uncharacterized protein n=1 Tax=Lecanosticta acicola TaxID=111012 RepID=A0AAI8Z8U0_9PEZI|nr:Hypothetical predicted protein [Lecanosticta acicola]
MPDITSTGSKNTEVQHNISSATGHRVRALPMHKQVRNAVTNVLLQKGSGDLFSGMKEYKRDSENLAQQQRRESLKDMSAKPQGGFLSNMWNSTFREPEKK